ncbi:MAG: hypothetical protein ACI85O_003028 [Saprospiraceae bacterium]|jgi:hypothetical protein
MGQLGELGFELSLTQKGLLLNNQRVLRQSIHESQDSLISQKFEEWKELNATLGKELLASVDDASTANSQTEVRQKIDNLERELAEKPNLFQDLIFDLSWKDLQSRLNEDEVIIDFSHFQYQHGLELADSTFYVAYIIRKNASSPKMISLFEEKELVAQKSLKQLYSFDKTSEKISFEKASWQKIQSYLQGVNTIYYSPSGHLHRMNFGAIPINKSETISDRFQLHNLGSTRQIEFSHPTPDYAITDAIIYGGIDYQIDNKSDILIDK